MQLLANPESDKLKNQIATLEQSFQQKIAKKKDSLNGIPVADDSEKETSVNADAEKKS